MKMITAIIGFLLMFPASSNAKFDCIGSYEYIYGIPLHAKCNKVLHVNVGSFGFITCEVSEESFNVWMEECNFKPYVENISDPIEVVYLDKKKGKAEPDKTMKKVDTGLVFYWDSEKFSGGIIFNSVENKTYIHVLH